MECDRADSLFWVFIWIISFETPETKKNGFKQWSVWSALILLIYKQLLNRLSVYLNVSTPLAVLATSMSLSKKSLAVTVSLYLPTPRKGSFHHAAHTSKPLVSAGYPWRNLHISLHFNLLHPHHIISTQLKQLKRRHDVRIYVVM